MRLVTFTQKNSTPRIGKLIDREIVEFELASVLDLVGITCPKRQCTRADFPSIGTFVG